MLARTDVVSVLEQVAAEQGKVLAPLSDQLALLDTGLDSLCFAIIVARLEDRIGFDPFSTAEDGSFPTTVGDFIRLYEQASPSNVAA
jgi:hypothetical protein